jgi:predicted nuclease of predicted toxin-antitoxin system
MKFLVDMNLSPLWVPFLTNQGFEAVHWSTVGQPWAPGEIVVRAIRTAEQYLEAGALVTVDPFRHRIRLLPI